MNIVLLYGGRSGEHEISLISAAAVARGLDKAHTVALVSVGKDGKWYLEEDSVLGQLRADPKAELSVHADKSRQVSVIPGGGREGAFSCGGRAIPCDVAFPVMHGSYSEDGSLQGLLEMAGVPYVGCGILASALGMDKESAKLMWQNAGIPVVPYRCLTLADVNDSRVYDSKIEEAVKALGFPLFVKPCAAGSSDGASKATNMKELSFALMEAFQWDTKVLIEKSIDAREVECSVTGNSITGSAATPETLLRAYGPGEIVPKHVFYDYDAKYNDPDGAELKIPADLDGAKSSYIKETALKAYRVLNASGMARVDFFIDRTSGDIYLNEINTIPGFTNISMFPKLCTSEGLDFTALTDLLLTQAEERFKARDALRTSR
ncbi:MAG: D-alanine--D-alanine ligase [Treponema sp.]|nr:D-alanine--D-alanine ligase [Treponema sp.]